MMDHELNRRTFLKRVGQAGGLIAAGGTLESILAACGGNVPTSTGGGSATAGTVKIGNKGLKTPGLLQWGADFVDGAPYVFKDPTNPSQLVGFEVEIAAAMGSLMSVAPKMIETCYGELEQALLSNKFDMVMNGWEITSDRTKTELFSVPYYRYGQQVVVRKGDPRFAQYTPNTTITLQPLEGYTVGTGQGYKAADYLATDSKVNVKLYNGDLPFDDLKQKKIDAVMVDVPIVSYYVQGAGPGGTPDAALQLMGKPLFFDVYVVGFNKSNSLASQLLPEINQAFGVLKKNGTLKRIYQKWSMWNDQQAQIGIM